MATTFLRRKARWVLRKVLGKSADMFRRTPRPAEASTTDSASIDEASQIAEVLRAITSGQGHDYGAEDLDRLRWSLVGWRDKGHIAEAVEGLRASALRWPEVPQFLLELLVIKSGGYQLDLDPVLAASPIETLTTPTVALFVGLEAARENDLARAREMAGHLVGVQAKDIAPFQANLVELLRYALLEEARTIYLTAAQDCDDPVSLGEAQRLTAELSTFFALADRQGCLNAVIRSLYFFDELAVPAGRQIIVAAVEIAAKNFTPDGKVVYLELMLANMPGHDRARGLIRHILEDESSRTSARFARAASIAAARLKDGNLEAEILARFSPPSQITSAADAANVAEVQLRRNARGLDKPMDVFVGFFGQLREPEAVLPNAVAAVRSAFSDRRHQSFNLHFALSTWPRTGGRPLSLSDAAGFFYQSVPVELRELFDGRNGSNGTALMKRLPNLTSLLIDHSTNCAARDTTLAELAALLPSGAQVITTPEDEIEGEVCPLLTRIGRAHPATINQMKMWSRIATLRQALALHESALGRAVDACLLMRCDLASVTGSLSELANRAVSPWENSSIFYDYDPHAEFIGGAGDRYMLGSRSSALELMQGYGHYLDIARSASPDPLAEQLTAHTGVQSLMVLRGLTPTPVWPLQYELHRGTPSSRSLIEALQADLAVADTVNLHTDIEAALGLIAAKSGGPA